MSRKEDGRLWWALLLLVPLAYNPISRWQYEPDKAALTLALTGNLLGQTLWRGTAPKGRATLSNGIIAGFLLQRWLTLSRSSAPHWSLWGDPAWRNGLWLTLAGLVLFILARGYFTTVARRAALVKITLIGSTVVAGYGLLQYAGLDPLHAQPWVRVPSTLAHPNLLAAYLAMVMPLTTAQLLSAKERRRRILEAVRLLVQGLCLIFTYSRAGWLATFSGLGMLALAWLWMQGRRRWAGGLLLAALVGFLTLLGLSLLPPLPGSAPHALQTLTSLFRWQGATVQIRLLGWQACLAAIARRPWLGYGPANVRAVLHRWMLPELAPFGGAGALGGRPHNVYLEVAVESGLIGLALFAALLTVLLAPLIRTVLSAKIRGSLPTSPPDTVYLAAALGALTANLVTYLFSFECITTAVFFWVLGGMAHAMVSPVQARGARRPVVGVLVAAGSLLIAGWMAAPDIIAYAGESLAQVGTGRAGRKALLWAGGWEVTPEPFWAVAGESCAYWATVRREPAIWRQGARLHDRLVRARPDVPEYWQRQGKYLRRWYRADPRSLRGELALAAYREALRLSPRDPDLWLDRGLLQLDLGRLDAALADFERAGALLDDYTRYYGAMSIYALATGDREAATLWQKRALEAQRAWDAWSWRR